jgi:hypothetical protein
MAEVTQLICYPVKGCAGVSLSHSTVDWTGLTHDRSFMVVGLDGTFFSQRRHREMAVIKAEIIKAEVTKAGMISEEAILRLSAPEADSLDVEISATGECRDVSVFTWQGKGLDQGNQAADWFSSVLGEHCRLVKVPRDHQRLTSGLTPGTTGFSDGHAVLVVSDASLNSLNQRSETLRARPVPMDRFRPNIVLSGWRTPHREDEIREMGIGSAEFGFAKVCVRCAVPMVDQLTGQRTGVEPIRTLATYRRTDKGVIFGMKAAVTRTGQLSVGDRVMVHSWAGPVSSADAAEPPLIAIASDPAVTG